METKSSYPRSPATYALTTQQRVALAAEFRQLPDDVGTDIRTAEAILGVSRATIVRMISRGELPATRIGTTYRITAGVLRRMLKGACVAGSQAEEAATTA